MNGKQLHYERKKELLGRHVVKEVMNQHSSGLIRSKQGKMPLSYIMRAGRGFRHQ